MEEKPLISIIVPIYNVEPYLKKCINSIINQTHTNIEIILINDGSTDASLEICEEAANKDQRIKVINKANGGVSSARNFGITEATAPWIMFLDSDDYLESNSLELLLQKAAEDNADIVAAAFFLDYCNRTVVWDETLGKEGTFNLEDDRARFISRCRVISSQLLPDDYNFGPLLRSPCAKLYRRSIIAENEICFPESLAIEEDNAFNIRMVCASKKISFINTPIYHYCSRESSATHSNADTLIDALVESSYYYDCLSKELEIEKEFFLSNAITLLNDLMVILNLFINNKEKLSKNYIKKINYLINTDSFGKYVFSNEFQSRLGIKERILVFLLRAQAYRIIIGCYKLKKEIK